MSSTSDKKAQIKYFKKKLTELGLESELSKQIASVNEYLKETSQKRSEAALFCDSLIPQLDFEQIEHLVLVNLLLSLNR